MSSSCQLVAVHLVRHPGAGFLLSSMSQYAYRRLLTIFNEGCKKDHFILTWSKLFYIHTGKLASLLVTPLPIFPLNLLQSPDKAKWNNPYIQVWFYGIHSSVSEVFPHLWLLWGASRVMHIASWEHHSTSLSTPQKSSQPWREQWSDLWLFFISLKKKSYFLYLAWFRTSGSWNSARNRIFAYGRAI